MDEATRKQFATELARKGGRAAAANSTPEERRARAKAAAEARWAKVKAMKVEGEK